LEVFGLATLRDLPDIEKLEEEGLLQRSQTEAELDGAFGLSGVIAESSRKSTLSSFEEFGSGIS